MKQPNKTKKEGKIMAEKNKEKEMKAVSPWRPFRDLTSWDRDMERIMEDFFGRRMRPWWRSDGLELRKWR